MDAQLLKTVGQIAGIGGLSLGVFLLLFREVIRKNVFPSLTKKHAFWLLSLIVILTWSIALSGIFAWVYVTKKPYTNSDREEKEFYEVNLIVPASMNNSNIFVDNSLAKIIEKNSTIIKILVEIKTTPHKIILKNSDGDSICTLEQLIRKNGIVLTPCNV